MTTRRIERLQRRFAVDLVLPGSKSIALRHIVMSTLANAPTQLDGVPRCDDVDALFDAVRRLGVSVKRQGKTAMVTPASAPVREPVEVDLGMSGVSLRLLLANASLRTATTRFTGHAQLHRRPNADLLDALERIGCEVESNDGCLPIAITGPTSPGDQTTLKTGVTSQYLSGLLLAAPRLPLGLTIHLEDDRASASYIGVTETEMARRGIDVRTVDDATLFVPPGEYGGGRVTIEGDASAATYHAAMATLHGGSVRFANLGDDTHQGEYAFVGLCERAGANVERLGNSVRIGGGRRLKPLGEVDMKDMPDAAPTLMAMAPFLPAATHLTGLATLRVKECDRIAAGTAELRKAGVRVDEFDDAMTVHPIDELRPAAFDTYQDHRMAMAMSVLASKVGGCDIVGAECVSKTYADYWEDFGRLYEPT